MSKFLKRDLSACNFYKEICKSYADKSGLNLIRFYIFTNVFYEMYVFIKILFEI